MQLEQLEMRIVPAGINDAQFLQALPGIIGNLQQEIVPFIALGQAFQNAVAPIFQMALTSSRATPSELLSLQLNWLSMQTQLAQLTAADQILMSLADNLTPGHGH